MHAVTLKERWLIVQKNSDLQIPSKYFASTVTSSFFVIFTNVPVLDNLFFLCMNKIFASEQDCSLSVL